MTTDELLQKLPSHIGNHPIFDKDGNIDAYVMIEPDDDIQWLYLHNDGKDWLASYGIEGEFLCMNPNNPDEKGFYNNAFAYGSTPNEALRGLYDWCKKNGFTKE